LKEISILKHFESLEDPRIERKKDHLLIDIVFITICATISGAESWDQIEEYGKTKIDWFKNLLKLKNGIPSHDTFNRVFSLLSPKSFEKCFLSWVNSIKKNIIKEVVSLDGKTIRRSKDLKHNKKPKHIISAWANSNKLVLGQVCVNEKSNEITALPILIDNLDLRGCIVTTDAMGCQKTVADKIIKAQADYVLALKENQGKLFEKVKEYFEEIINKNEFKELSTKTTENTGHGRTEERQYFTSKKVKWLPSWGKFENFRSITMVISMRLIRGKMSTEKRYYISSLEKISEISQAIREHWGVENSLHWTLDTCFREDECRKREGNAAENFDKIRHISLNILKADTKSKMSIKTKRLKAAWDIDYLLSLFLMR